MNKEAWEISAANEMDDQYKAMITGIKNSCGGDDYYACKLEFLIEETMEVVWRSFAFSFNLNNACSWKEPGPNFLDDSNSRGLCRLLGIDEDYMFHTVIYGKENPDNPYYPNHDLDPDLLIGKEIGVVLGDGFQRIKEFISVSDLFAMSVPD